MVWQVPRGPVHLCRWRDGEHAANHGPVQCGVLVPAGEVSWALGFPAHEVVKQLTCSRVAGGYVDLDTVTRSQGAHMKVRAIAVAGVLLALTGCSASTPTGTADTATAWTVHEAGQQFQALYVPAAKINNKYVAALARNDFPAAAGLAAQLATSEGAFLVALSKGRWPSAARGPVKVLIAAMLPVRQDAVDLSNAYTRPQVDAVPLRADTRKLTTAFGQVQLALGLPV